MNGRRNETCRHWPQSKANILGEGTVGGAISREKYHLVHILK